MIKFLKDWDNYPTAIIHYNTSNKSFLRYAGLLKAMGVKNHAFCLALINPNLEHINPHEEKLSIEQIAMVVKECKENPWYIFREVIRIPANSGTDPVILEANRGNISLFWLFFNHITAMLIQPRQTGKSVSVDSLMISLLNILCVKTYIHLLTKDDGLRSKNIQRLKDLQSELPYYLNLKTKQDANNTERITVNRLGNNYVTSVPQASEKAARNVGRGYTVAIHHIDEIAFINNIDITLPALLASSNAAVDSAKLNGAPYGNLFTTTAGFLATSSGKYAKEKIYDKSLRWSEHLYDCDSEEDLVSTIKKNNPSGNVSILLEFNHRQLGKTDQWLREKMAAAFSEGENAEADYLNKWSQGNLESPIPKDLLEKINKSFVGDPYIDISEYGYITKWYIPKAEVLEKIKNRKLIMGLDTSEANGGDDISMSIRDSDSGETIATGCYNELNTIVFSEWIAEWLVNYTNLTLVIEKRSTGSSMIENILLLLPQHNIDPFRRLFNWVVDESHVNEDFKEALETPMHKRNMQFYDRYKRYFGFATSGSGKTSRSMLYGKVFNNAIYYTANTVRDATLISQLTGLTKKNGRIDHGVNGHDDSVIAWLLSYWFLSEAKNKQYYGLDSRSILSIVQSTDIMKLGGREAIIKKEKNILIRREIEYLQEKIKSSSSSYEKIMINNRLNSLMSQVDKDFDNKLNSDRLIEQANKELVSYNTRPIRLFDNYVA